MRRQRTRVDRISRIASVYHIEYTRLKSDRRMQGRTLLQERRLLYECQPSQSISSRIQQKAKTQVSLDTLKSIFRCWLSNIP